MAGRRVLLDQIERLRTAQSLSDDPFVRRVLGLAIEALEQALAIETENEEDPLPPH